MNIQPSSQRFQDVFEVVRLVANTEQSMTAKVHGNFKELYSHIADTKKNLVDSTAILSDFNQRLERVSWFTDVSTEELELIKELISDMKRTHNNLLRNYKHPYYNFCKEKGIAKEELKAFKIAIDDYKENIDDIESIYFRLPHRADFMALNEDLASL